MKQLICQLITGQLLLAALIYAAPDIHSSLGSGSPSAHLDSPALRVISDEDKSNLQTIKHHIQKDYTEFKSINEVHAFLDKVKLLVQKHPKNVAFAQDELKELLKFLSQETVTQLIRIDTDPFVMPIDDSRLKVAQDAVSEDELTGKLFGYPLRSLIESRKQHNRHDEGNHKDGNFFSNFWCKMTNTCNN